MSFRTRPQRGCDSEPGAFQRLWVPAFAGTTVSGIGESLNRVAHTMTRFAIIVALALACMPAFAQPRYGLSPDAYAVFSRWMTSSCVGDEAGALNDALRRYRVELAPAFRQALADGPPADALRSVRTAAESRYAELAKFPINEYRVEGMTTDALAQRRRVSRQSYAADQAQRYASGYRSNAVAGLGIVGGPQARALLSRLASRRGDLLALPATEAIKALDRE